MLSICPIVTSSILILIFVVGFISKEDVLVIAGEDALKNCRLFPMLTFLSTATPPLTINAPVFKSVDSSIFLTVTVSKIPIASVTTIVPNCVLASLV